MKTHVIFTFPSKGVRSQFFFLQNRARTQLRTQLATSGRVDGILPPACKAFADENYPRDEKASSAAFFSYAACNNTFYKSNQNKTLNYQKNLEKIKQIFEKIVENY